MKESGAGGMSGAAERRSDAQIYDAVHAALLPHVGNDMANFLAALNSRVHALEKLVRLRAPFQGAEHDFRCPADDTCDCEGKPINELIQSICEVYEENSAKSGE